MDRSRTKTSLSLQETTDKTGTGKHVNRKTLHRQYASLQSDSSMDRNSGDDHSLNKNQGAKPIGVMKPSASMGDFQPRCETTRVLTTSATLPEDSTETSEVIERSSLTRSRTLANEISNTPPLNTLADGAIIMTPKGADYKSPKSADKFGSLDPLNAANAATKHRRERFQKTFPDIASTDEMLQYYYCAYSREILFPGFLYVTNGWLCFHSKIMGKKNIRIPVQSIVDITKARTAKLIPNAIGIVTRQDRYVFASLVSRDRTYSLLMTIWQGKKTQGDEDSLNGSSQNGERHDGNDGISGSTDDDENLRSASDDSPYFDSHLAVGSRSDLQSVEPDDVTLKRHTAQSTRDCPPAASQDVGKKSESSGMGDNRRGWRSRFSSPLHKSSLTTVILFLTTILIIFLIASACLLAFKLIHLQAQMEASLILPSVDLFQDSTEPKDGVNEEIYFLKHEQHLSSIQRLHSLLEVHLKLLDKVNQSLKGLRQSSLSSCSGLTPTTADEYAPDSNS